MKCLDLGKCPSPLGHSLIRKRRDIWLLQKVQTGKNGHAPSYVVSPTGREFVGRVNDYRRRK
ncbi:Uncharacterized protein APZ42_025918 [Daphnia magna]|uniref:Uncharacterized protein n=1 Tax=Daphnia magna TaxID=35525 RepID=A0A164SMU5_9CRUS|nr:Uncharacterized protein APZ42_025918 [Daphnia magna]